ncbi:MAG: diguanylate cyclase [Candidatus Brocadiaceae bacterium]|jgi:Amt family ammonium transporter
MRVRELEQEAAGRRAALQKTRQMFEEILSAEPNAILTFDAESVRVAQVNDAAVELYGYSREEFGELRFTDLSAEPDRTQGNVAEALVAERDIISGEYHRTRDADIFPAEVTTHAFDLGEGTSLCAVVRDVTENRWAHEELLRIRAAVASASDAVLIVDLNQKAIYANEAFRRLFACDLERMEREGLESLFADPEVTQQLRRATYNGKNWSGETEMVAADGSRFTGFVRGTPVRDEENRVIDMLVLFSDVTEQKQIEERLLYEATHDALTGLVNRRYLMTRLGQAVYSAQRYHHPVSICLCDLDGFKAVNDTYGHTVGDKVLSRFGELMNAESRAGDIPGRYGGDEFCIVLPHTAADRGASWAERIRRRLEEIEFQADGQTFGMTATFGIAELSQDHEDESDLLVAADRALYRAKEKGRNCIARAEGGAA